MEAFSCLQYFRYSFFNFTSSVAKLSTCYNRRSWSTRASLLAHAQNSQHFYNFSTLYISVFDRLILSTMYCGSFFFEVNFTWNLKIIFFIVDTLYTKYIYILDLLCYNIIRAKITSKYKYNDLTFSKIYNNCKTIWLRRATDRK